MGTMDIGFSVIESLKAVESWINNINTNMTGAAKTGYKATRISLGGSNTEISSLPAGGSLPVQQAEPSMRITSTAIDFTQGQIVAASQDTSFAIQDRPGIAGTNFFVVRDLADTSGKVGSTADNTGNNYNYYLTRDGEFHWTPASQTGGNQISVPANSADTVQGFVLVNNYNLIVLNQNGVPLFEQGGTFPNPPAQADDPIIVNARTPQNLTFSRYGSTIFNNNFASINTFNIPTPPITSFQPVISGNNSYFLDASQDAPGLIDPNNGGTAAQKANHNLTTTADRIQSSLESSNASVTTLIPELTLAQKMFTALSKVLTVFNENLDITFGLIR